MEVIAQELGKEFYVTQVSFAGSWREITKPHFDVLLIDISIRTQSLTSRIASTRSLIEDGRAVIIMADSNLRFIAEDLIHAGAFASCQKPPSIPDLAALLRNARKEAQAKSQIQTHGSHNGLSESRRQYDLVGSAPRMNEIYDAIERVKNLDAPVLITGESGTGKELVARAIHNSGARSSRPFTAVSCSAIPESLIESELFGHERGAFTGSISQHLGYFEQAGEGSLFLDEIGDISLYSQVKLLRVIQQREFGRLGGTRNIKLRARLIFATHRNLAKMVRDETFRQDLFYRINVIHIHLPALREHAEDIPEIAQHIALKYSSLYNQSSPTFSDEAMHLLMQHNWPGNVRELENIVQNAMVLASSSLINTHDIQLLSLPPSNADVISSAPPASGSSFEESLRNYKFKIASDAVQAHNGNKTLAARSLNVSRSYLHRLLHLGDHDFHIDNVLQ